MDQIELTKTQTIVEPLHDNCVYMVGMTKVNFLEFYDMVAVTFWHFMFLVCSNIGRALCTLIL